mmetsp:Transcript_28334/g.76760  ORF Transcript_28334/g.76760 Transcript_28334/m.76760 type:complete len:161 (-) Transcript_28334:1183-1665(-)
MCNENETTQLIPLVDDGGGESKRAGSGKPMNRQTSDDFIASFSEALSESMQRIGVLGSVSIAVNSLTGPAMLTLPATYQRSGLIPTTAAIVFTCILSAFCCLHMSNTISKVQHNHDFSFDVSHMEQDKARLRFALRTSHFALQSIVSDPELLFLLLDGTT